MNIVGRLRNNNYSDADGKEVYGLAFTVDEIDYLDSRAEAEARRAREGGAAETSAAPVATARASERQRVVGKGSKTVKPSGIDKDDIPF